MREEEKKRKGREGYFIQIISLADAFRAKGGKKEEGRES